jgi:hypothetical protein
MLLHKSLAFTLSYFTVLSYLKPITKLAVIKTCYPQQVSVLAKAALINIKYTFQKSK